MIEVNLFKADAGNLVSLFSYFSKNISFTDLICFHRESFFEYSPSASMRMLFSPLVALRFPDGGYRDLKFMIEETVRDNVEGKYSAAFCAYAGFIAICCARMDRCISDDVDYYKWMIDTIALSKRELAMPIANALEVVWACNKQAPPSSDIWLLISWLLLRRIGGCDDEMLFRKVFEVTRRECRKFRRPDSAPDFSSFTTPDEWKQASSKLPVLFSLGDEHFNELFDSFDGF